MTSEELIKKLEALREELQKPYDKRGLHSEHVASVFEQFLTLCIEDLKGISG